MPKYICDKCKNEYEGKFCPECGDKTTKKDKEVMTDKEIINDLINDTKNKMKDIELHNKISIVFFIISFNFDLFISSVPILFFSSAFSLRALFIVISIELSIFSLSAQIF